ncbi:MAG: peptidase E [Chloroflexi bacterium]|nr:peptidase E [Chloroflexota bacterium]
MLDSVQVEYTRMSKMAALAVFPGRPANDLAAPRVGDRFHMGKIVAIGGGDFRTGETLALDREVVRLTGTSRPRALFIPTASSDSVEDWEAFRAAYGGELGCDAYVLNLLTVPPSSRELAEAILSSDLVYVGGGNTLKMMRRWRKLGVDLLLRQAYDRGIVLSGVSAGAICWFRYGHSDSMSFYRPEAWSYIRVEGMGLIDATACPHYDGDTAGVKRATDFQEMVKRRGDLGIGIDNCCALEVVDGGYRVIVSRTGAGAYKLYARAGEITAESIPQSADFAPLADLLQK